MCVVIIIIYYYYYYYYFGTPSNICVHAVDERVGLYGKIFLVKFRSVPHLPCHLMFIYHYCIPVVLDLYYANAADSEICHVVGTESDKVCQFQPPCIHKLFYLLMFLVWVGAAFGILDYYFRERISHLIFLSVPYGIPPLQIPNHSGTLKYSIIYGMVPRRARHMQGVTTKLNPPETCGGRDSHSFLINQLLFFSSIFTIPSMPFTFGLGGVALLSDTLIIKLFVPECSFCLHESFSTFIVLSFSVSNIPRISHKVMAILSCSDAFILSISFFFFLGGGVAGGIWWNFSLVFKEEKGWSGWSLLSNVACITACEIKHEHTCLGNSLHLIFPSLFEHFKIQIIIVDNIITTMIVMTFYILIVFKL
ncbi:hypothetical protein VP01_895g2 [Puccinia sorghi]|uniref:Uncharacterized protein n=1 Tax=Puccinia sorghi TaxID=27349 RepID=A0A0L6U7W8_9BASI|nr:hypothetical protein VP01_895g2 [Puccinia sorghi]